MAAQKRTTEPLDGGWGWACVIGGSVSFFVLGGMPMSFSLIYQQIRNRFDCTASDASWVYALYSIICMGAGPIATGLCQRFSCRTIAMAGGVFMAIGLVMAGMATNLIQVYIGFGVTTAFGASMCGNATYITINTYFRKWRSRALAMSSMGDGIGGLVIAQVLVVTFEKYGYAGAMMILAGIALQCTAAGALFRAIGDNKAKSFRTSEENDVEVNYVACKDSLSELDYTENKSDKGNDCIAKFYRHENGGKLLKVEVPVIAEIGLQDYKNSIIQEDEKFPNEKNDSVVKKINEIPTELQSVKRSRWESFKIIFLKYLDIRLLAIPQFVCMAMIAGCVSASIGVTNMYLAPHSKDRGLTPRQISTLMSTRAGVFSAAKILSGCFFDSKWVRERKVYIFPFLGFFQAAFIWSIPLASDVVSTYAIWILTAIITCWMVTQESGVVCDVVGVDRFSSALGIARFIRGMLAFSGNVIGAKLSDSGSYDNAFFFGGSLVMLATIIFQTVNVFLHSCRQEKLSKEHAKE